MKKALFLLLLLLLTLLCGCSAPMAEPSALPYTQRTQLTENELWYHLLDENGNVVSDMAYNRIRLTENFAVCYFKNDGIEQVRVLDYSGKQLGMDYDSVKQINYKDTAFLGKTYYAAKYSDLHRRDYQMTYILNEYGEPAVDLPLSNYRFSPKGSDYNDGYDAFYATIYGTKLCYEIVNGDFVLRYRNIAGAFGTSVFGAKRTIYYRDTYEPSYGIRWNPYFEDIYSSTEIPFENRFILGEGNPQDISEYMQTLADENKNVLAKYSRIWFKLFYDGTYIGVAYAAPESAAECTDSDGNAPAPGYVFIDRDGKAVSPVYSQLSLPENGDIFTISSPDNEITATTGDKSEVTFSASKYTLREPTTFYLGTVEGIEVYMKIRRTGGTRPDLVYHFDGELNEITEVPETEYTIVDKNGKKLIDHPFYDFTFWEEGISGLFEIYETPGFVGCYKGNEYIYNFVDGKFQLTYYGEAGTSKVSYDPAPGYVHTRYTYAAFETHYGLNDKDGNVILKPIFSYIINAPLPGRFIAGTNNIAREDGYECCCTLFDENKNVLCQYNSIGFYTLDDGSYIGIAYYGGFDSSGNVLRDKNGDVLKIGHRFIDKDGNELSPCFSADDVAYEDFWNDPISEHLNEPITIVADDGSELSFMPADYVRKP